MGFYPHRATSEGTRTLCSRFDLSFPLTSNSRPSEENLIPRRRRRRSRLRELIKSSAPHLKNVHVHKHLHWW
jgi:hypothetical protein